jgi:predicted nucleic acid-binding protein
MPAKVVDASVIAALAFLEPRADEARELLRAATLFAPEILPYELAGAALKKSRGLDSGGIDARSRLRDALSLGVQLIHITPLVVFELALEAGLSVYDAAYLHAAVQLKCPLVTFDAKLERQARLITRA